MLQCCEIGSGYFILHNYITKEKIKPLIKGTILERYEFIDDEPHILKELLLAEAEKIDSQSSMNETHLGTVPVDHSFNVKGIGPVILGLVTDGTINKHDTLNVLPGIKTTQIRSIQKHDDEFDTAQEGDRVGLALKNVKIDDVERGTVLTSDSSVKTSKRIKSQASLLKYWHSPLKPGMVIHLGHWMQFLTSRIESINDNGDWHKLEITLILEKDIVYHSEDQAVLMYLEGGKLRIAGTVKLP